MQNLSGLELTDISFDLTKGELLKVHVFSMCFPCSVTLNITKYKFSVEKLIPTRIQSELHCPCVKGTPRRNFHHYSKICTHNDPAEQHICVAFTSSESAEISEKLFWK